LKKLLKKYNNAQLKGKAELATKIAHEIADETIRLEIASVKELKKQWLS